MPEAEHETGGGLFERFPGYVDQRHPAALAAMGATAAILGTAIAVGACGNGTKPSDSPSYWNGPRKASELKVGPYTVPIPTGWRSMAELKSDAPQLDPGLVGMSPETLETGALRTNIILSWTALPPNSIDPKAPPCAGLAAATAKQFEATAADVATVHIDGDAGCRFTYANASARVGVVIGFVGDHELVLNWTHMTSLVQTSDTSVWRGVLAGLHVAE